MPEQDKSDELDAIFDKYMGGEWNGNMRDEIQAFINQRLDEFAAELKKQAIYYKDPEYAPSENAVPITTIDATRAKFK